LTRAKPIVLGGLVLAALGVLAGFLAWRAGAKASDAMSIVLDPASGTIELRGVSAAESVAAEAWAARLRVHPAGADPSLPAMVGTYAVDGDRVRFQPRFPLVPGLPYRVRYGDGAQTHETTVTLPARASAARARVMAIYPSANELPANQLKFYVTFSAPMMVGEARERVRLLDEDGREVPRAFLWLEDELWDRSRQRLTLILDPGRVKRGLRANIEDGAPLVEGHRYRLTLDGAWRDGNGSPLGESFAKEFRVVAADRRSPDPTQWQVVAPAAASREPLVVRFDEPLDFALLHEMLEVPDNSGAVVDGTMTVLDGERAWRFVPRRDWPRGSFIVRVRPQLEDRSGNELHQLFDADVRTASKPDSAWVELGFATR
jgi:hypothetical protein